MTKQLIIAAISARGYARAAKELAYEVVSLDAFSDLDTQSFSRQSLQVEMLEEDVDEADFKQKFVGLSLNDECNFIYGSLFDSNPALLNWVAELVTIIGNLPETLQFSRSLNFFSLLDDLEIAYPEVSLEIANRTEGWLVKKLAGTGGTHVKPASIGCNGDYFQRKVKGNPFSLLFLADGKTSRKVGFNQQLLAPSVDKPYRFAGAVSNIVLPLNVQQELIEAAQRLTAALGLRGLNSLDAVLDGGKVWILELNPRLSATFHLYPNLLTAHIAGSKGEFVELPKSDSSKAEFVLYASELLIIPTDFIWPDWVADIPNRDADMLEINESEPICTVLAEAKNAMLAHQLVLERVEKLKGKLFHD